MTTCHVHKASPHVPDDPTESLTIHIDESIPDADVPATLATFQGDAARLADALLDTLPGGTIDQLLSELLQRRASLFRVRFPATDGGPS